MIERVSCPDDDNSNVFRGHDPITGISFGDVLVFSNHPDFDYVMMGADSDTRACKDWFVKCGTAKYEDIGRIEHDISWLVKPKQKN